MIWLMLTIFIAFYKSKATRTHKEQIRTYTEPTKYQSKPTRNVPGFCASGWFLVSSWWILLGSGRFIFYNLRPKVSEHMFNQNDRIDFFLFSHFWSLLIEGNRWRRRSTAGLIQSPYIAKVFFVIPQYQIQFPKTRFET